MEDVGQMIDLGEEVVL
jgi:hypothetical protein